jgi:DNA-binding MarR family transcriptional regulator
MNDNDYGMLIKYIHDSIEKHANNDLRKKEITIMQLRFLRALYEKSDYTYSYKELEKHFNVAQSTIVGIAKRLEKKKFVNTFMDASDKRAKFTRLTSSGVELCIETLENIKETEELLTSRLTKEEEKLLKDLLCKVYEAIK